MATRIMAVLMMCAFLCGGRFLQAQNDVSVWTLQSEGAFWTVSKATGALTGGWNAVTREQCLLGIEGSYFLEDSQSVLRAVERDDRVIKARLSPDGRRLELVCVNPSLEGIGITKVYRSDGNTLARTLAFRSDLPTDKFFLYCSEARLDAAYRREGNYVGASCSFGPVEPAASFMSEKPGTYFGTHSKAMVLSNPIRGWSFAHYRSKMDDRFVFPWWTYNRVESDKECFYYTPSGWRIPFGVLKLESGKEVSYEENVSIFRGDSNDFVMKEYPRRADVAAQMRRISPPPAWLADVVLVTSEIDGDLNNIRRMVEMTDEGAIMVLVDFGGLWCDYYVDQEQLGLCGGYTTGPELRDWIRKIKAISPRVKAGLYAYMDSAMHNSSLYRKHPEWFRARDKQGRLVNHFGSTDDYIHNFTTMFNVRACRRELLAQFKLMLEYLDTDFIYMDDPLTNNLVNWETGQVLTEADEYQFQEELREVVRRCGRDKAVFLNGAGAHPYADINFVEAYSRLKKDQWRTFAGVALGVEAFLTGVRPGCRVVPLYWVPELSREYVNRTLALGWVPCLQYTDDVDSRPFVTAAYEIGNADTLNAVYAPDWRRDPQTSIESYAVRRLGDSAALLSFTSHAAQPARTRIEIESDSLGLDRSRDLHVWSYAVQDATTFRGSVSEKVSRAIYRESGWTLDRVARPVCNYGGPYAQRLAFDLDLHPDILNLVVVSDVPAAIYSVEDLPCNFLFARARGAEVKVSARPDRSIVEADVRCERKTCEVVVFALDGLCVNRLALDGRAVAPRWTFLGGKTLPIVPVERGRHTLRVEYAPDDGRTVSLAAAASVTADQRIRVTVPDLPEGASHALIAVEKDGLPVFSGLRPTAGRTVDVPVPPRRGGEYEVAVRAVFSPSGMSRADGGTSRVHLPENLPALGLTSATPGFIPGETHVTSLQLTAQDVWKKSILRTTATTIAGIEVLNAAYETTSTSGAELQPGLKGLTAFAWPDILTAEAGTTRKVQGVRGAAYAGFEIRGVKGLKVRLENTYHDAYSISGVGIHTHRYYPSSRAFAGFILDYHTKAGYTSRVALSVGVMHPECSSPGPGYGKPGPADRRVDLGPIVNEGPVKDLDLDLSKYAPPDWDGQAWVSVGSDWVASDRCLTLRILGPLPPSDKQAVGGVR